MDDARVREPPLLEREGRRPATARALSRAEQRSQNTLGNDRFLLAIDSLLSSSLTYLLWLLRLLIPGTDGYFSHRPKEKVRVDSNNENSVPKDFENIDNSNFGARSQTQRLPPPGKQKQGLLEKAHAQQSLGKNSNEVIEFAKNKGGLNKTRTDLQQRANPTRFQQHRHNFQKRTAIATTDVKYDQPPKCEIIGKEALSAFNRATTKECRQQIVEVYCRHKENQLMPDKVSRYCPVEGE
ncbi:hypothetical protein DNTS_017816 [Danionella cerebrum]|uniref:Uncharacterized protein n=1 Tax=Danionella cerebrum TaxID=2873325 RepID=A0A553R065_9TELE|nr:hypothetical protein DNTS_017816 [Danionella translucida]